MKRILVIAISLLCILSLHGEDEKVIQPQTIEQAVEWLHEHTNEKIKNQLVYTNDNLHHSLGMYLRNELGLWNYENPLFLDTKEKNADGASSRIIYEFKKQLIEALPKQAQTERAEMISLYDRILKIEKRTDFIYTDTPLEDFILDANQMIHANGIPSEHSFVLDQNSTQKLSIRLPHIPIGRGIEFSIHQTASRIRYDYPNIKIITSH